MDSSAKRHPEFAKEMAALLLREPREHRAATRTIARLLQFGNALGFPDSSNVQSAAVRGIRELRPRRGRSRWRPLYAITENGIYLVEDTHTSLWRGQYMDRPDGQTVLQFAFNRCAELMDWTGRMANFQALGNRQAAQALEASASLFCRTTKSVSFYDSVIVFERGRRQVPLREQR